jgi:hypothetical protein
LALIAALQLAVATVYAAYLRVEGTPEKVGLVCILQKGLGVARRHPWSFVIWGEIVKNNFNIRRTDTRELEM